MVDANKKFGARLKTLRQAAGLSQRQLWKLSGVHCQTVSKIERGDSLPGLATVFALADAIGVSPAALVSDLDV